MWRRKTEKEKEENILRRKISFREEKEKGEIIRRRKINGDANQLTNQPTGLI